MKNYFRKESIENMTQLENHLWKIRTLCDHLYDHLTSLNEYGYSPFWFKPICTVSPLEGRKIRVVDIHIAICNPNGYFEPLAVIDPEGLTYEELEKEVRKRTVRLSEAEKQRAHKINWTVEDE